MFLYLPFFANNQVAHPLSYAVLTVVTAAGYYYYNAYVLVPKYFEMGHYVRFFGILVTCGLTLAAARIWLEYQWLGDDILHAFPSRERYHLYAVTNILFVALVSSYNQILSNRRRAATRAQEIIARDQENQLLYLRAQINPHFLFNTLNNIYALSLAQSPDTPEMVLRLAGLLRYAIYSTSQQFVTVEEEVAEIEELLALYRLRCVGPVDLRLEILLEARGGRLEPMLLVPLVENCLKHGDVEYNPTGFVHLRLSRQDHDLVFEARNTTDTPAEANPAPVGSAEGVAPHGVGLNNIRRRLELTYPPEAAALLTSRENGVFTSVLRLPFTR